MQKKTVSSRTSEPSFSLGIRTERNEPVISFPAEVIDATHHLINQAGKRNRKNNLEAYTAFSQNKNESLPPSISMVAALRGEGVTYLSWALAATLVQDYSAKVCVVDLNWWWPFISPLTTTNNPGVGGIVNQKIKSEDCIVPTALANLVYLPAGNLGKHERNMIAHAPGLKALMNELTQQFDHIILDIPSIQATPNSVPLAQLGEGCCLVVRHGTTPIKDVQDTLDEIGHLTILGVILNQVKYRTPAWLERILPPL
jgi:Mrp family chromosome partitioning ATPase